MPREASISYEQVAAIADDIAYDNHDIDDGLRAGFLRFDELLAHDMVAEQWRAIERPPRPSPCRRPTQRRMSDAVSVTSARPSARRSKASRSRR